MKPLKLVMSAFGPYAGQTEIDFTKYEEKGLFLITGPTGSGKTTIFDGICFALFGKASGEYRGTGHLRSDYAPEAVKTFVEFTFEHQGHTFAVRREPAQERRKIRGSGTRIDPEKAYLEQEGRPSAEGVSKVNDRIAELLNISYDQFKQVAMIAQSEFYSLLNANTNDRTEILRSIFSTGAYDQIGQILKRYSDESHGTCEEAKRSILQYYGDVRITEYPTGGKSTEEIPAEENSAVEAAAGQSVHTGSPEDGPAMNSVDPAGTSADDIKVLYASYISAKDRYFLIRKETEAADGDSGIRDTGLLSDTVRDLVRSETGIAKMLKGKAEAKEKQVEEINRRLATAVENNRKIDSREKREKEYSDLLAREPEMKGRRKLYEQRRTAAHEIKPVYDQAAAQKKRVQSALDAVKEGEARLKEAGQKAVKQRILAEEAEKAEPKASEQQAAARQIERDRESYENLEKIKAGLEKLQKDRDRLGRESESASAALNRLDETIRENETLQKKLQKVPVRLSEKENTIRRIQDLRDKLQILTGDRMEEYRKAEQILAALQQICQKDSDSYDQALEASEKAEKILQFSQAGILAMNLQEGQPCPVCGAVHHPKKASLPEHSVTEEEVNKAKKKTEAARKKREESLTQAKEQNVKFRLLEKNLCEDLKEALSRDPAENRSTLSKITDGNRSAAEGSTEYTARQASENTVGMITGGLLSGDSGKETLPELENLAKRKERELAGRLQEEKEVFTALKKDNETLQNSLDVLEKARKDRADAEDRRGKLNETLQQITEELSKKQGQMESLKKLPYEDWKTAEKRMRSFDAAAKAIRDHIKETGQEKKKADEAAARAETAYSSSQESLKKEQDAEADSRKALDGILTRYGYQTDEEAASFFASEEELKSEEQELQDYVWQRESARAAAGQAAVEAEGLSRIDTDFLQKSYEQRKGESQLLRARYAEASERIRGNEDVIRKMESRAGEYEQSHHKYQTARKLYRLISGQTAAGKITFEQYVQAAKFDGIIRAANRRLSRMSQGQYELFRQTESIGKRTNTFLDLEVLDHYTGRRRPVNTLSGGESFDASLSLALGLSDTISSNLGGIQIDALFVDEGFGTLDTDSIARVLDTLQSLSGTHKLVGVISHREELADAILQKIIVEKGPEGSRIREEDDST